MNVYRAPMRARDRDEPGAWWGLRHGLVAIATDPERIVPRFEAVPDGAFVWTRDEDGWFWLGRIKGPARRVESPVGLPLARDVRWMERPVSPEEAPAGVVATFARGGRNFQRIHDAHAEQQTEDLWCS